MANPIPANVYTPSTNLETAGSLHGEYYMTLRLGPYERPTPFYRTNFKTEKLIVLPLPSELRDDTTVGYSTSDLATVGDIINGDMGGAAGAFGLRRAGGLAGALAGGIGGAVGTAVGMVGNKNATPEDIAADSQRGAQMARRALDTVAPPDQITSAIQQSLGLAPNPNPSVMFTGMELRSFNMSWSFMPRNKAESANVSKIIKTLKELSLPSTHQRNVAAVLKYPYMCQVNFYPWDANYGANEWGWGADSIIRMKRCFIASVGVNYAPSNVPAFFEGTKQPTTILVSVNLREMEYFLSEDWSDRGTQFESGRAPFSGGIIDNIEDFGRRIANAAGEISAQETQKALNAQGLYSQ